MRSALSALRREPGPLDPASILLYLNLVFLREEIKQRRGSVFGVAVAIHAKWLLIRASLVIAMAGRDLGYGTSLRSYADCVVLNWLMKLAKAIDEK